MRKRNGCLWLFRGVLWRWVNQTSGNSAGVLVHYGLLRKKKKKSDKICGDERLLRRSSSKVRRDG